MNTGFWRGSSETCRKHGESTTYCKFVHQIQAIDHSDTIERIAKQQLGMLKLKGKTGKTFDSALTWLPD